MRPHTAGLLVAVLYLLHQDLWFWGVARPLVFGFLPIGLFYHAAFTLACALVLWLLVRGAWPAHLERVASEPDAPRAGPGSGAPADGNPARPRDGHPRR